MPLLTHEETGSTSVARTQAVALAERPPLERRDTSRRGAAWRRIRRSLYVLLGVTVLGPVLAFVVGWLIFPVPSPEEVAVEQVSRYTYADGTELAVFRPDGVNRQVVRLDEVPEHVREAVLAAENRSFYSDPGFDITGIMRAVLNQLSGGVGGGSTITQQYVKVVTGDDDFSLIRKYKEVVLAVKITREQTKDEILENYLNVIYLGRSSYGIQAASQSFFGKDVGELTVSEGAMLAGMIQAPSRWDPAEDLDGSTRRWNYVMDQMTEATFLTPAERAAEAFPTNWLPEAPPVEGVPADDRGHIYERAKDEVLAMGIVSEQRFDTEGLTITTTIDPASQREAVEAVTGELDGQPDTLRSALVSIDPRTGAVQAYYGGPDGQGTDYAQALRPPGSSYKPFVLAAALMADPEIGLGTRYDGSSPQQFPGNPSPVRNSEGYDCARCSVQTAMTRSINTIFYQLGLDAGPQRVIDAAHAAGIPADLATDPRGGIALGDQDVRPINMASAYATLAADGVYREPYLVERVTAADGRVLFTRADAEAEERQALPQQVARNVTEAMLDVAGFARIGLDDGRPVAGKTGTVQAAQDGQNKDAWMVGYTPSVATAVWVGSDFSDPIQTADGRAIYGRMLPGSIWQSFMDATLEGTEREEFSEFEPLGRAPVSESVDDGNRRSTSPSTPSGNGDGAENGDAPGVSGSPSDAGNSDEAGGEDDGSSGADVLNGFPPSRDGDEPAGDAGGGDDGSDDRGGSDRSGSDRSGDDRGGDDRGDSGRDDGDSDSEG